MFKKILITGGSGFVGRHVIEAFRQKGIKPRVLDNFSCSSRESFKRYLPYVDLHEGDIRDAAAVRKAVAGVEAVFHFAAIRSVAKSVEDPSLSHEVNATGALLLLDASAKAGVKHFLFTSTSAVYGEAAARFQKEDGKLAPISPYGVAKLAAEYYARYYFKEHHLPTTTVRIFNVYGPRQNPESRYSLVVPGVLSKIVRNQPPVIDGTGDQARDFIYIGDIVDAFFKAMGNPRAFGKVYNLGAGKALSINTIARHLLKLSRSSLKPVHGPRRPGDPERTCADISRIKRELGWKPKVSLIKGLEKTIEGYEESTKFEI
ncbi:MAG: GDP-mannose 4,6-dehydratase, partial [Candidatus Omnitrophica bacterium]|nr:GDP-mannose 4,6-dehydratase [Candidatus Omnitrophota bacterium]